MYFLGKFTDDRFILKEKRRKLKPPDIEIEVDIMIESFLSNDILFVLQVNEYLSKLML